MNIRLATKQESKDNVIGTSRIGYVDSSFGNLKTLLGFPNVIDATSGGSNIALDPSVLTNSVDNKVHFEWHVIVNHGDLLKEFFMTIYGYKLFDSYGKARSIDESIDYGWSIGMNTFDHDDISVEFQEEITSIIKDALTFPHKVNDADVTFELKEESLFMKNMREVSAMKKENEDLKRKIRIYKEQKADLQERYARRCRAYETLRANNSDLKENNSYWKNIKENEVSIKQAEIDNLKKEIKEVRHYAGIDDVNIIRN